MQLDDIRSLSKTDLEEWDNLFHAAEMVYGAKNGVKKFQFIAKLPIDNRMEFAEEIEKEIDRRQSADVEAYADTIEMERHPDADDKDWRDLMLRKVVVQTLRLLELYAPPVIIKNQVELLQKYKPEI